MSALSALGLSLSIDDFGTGYSSLSQLKRFDVHKLKIDQSFVRDVVSDSEDQAIVLAIIQMAHSLGMVTLAEGVETQEQLAFLKANQCDEMQGYLYRRPLEKDDFAQLLRSPPPLPLPA
jgi:EAL domain-containing protein (putative c-di-GMP-specific phosphodiesterase class I)